MSPLYGGQIPLNEERLSFLDMNGLSPTGEALCFASGLWCADFAYLGFRANEEVDYACEIVDKNIIVDENALFQIRDIVGAGLDKACCGCTYCVPYCPKQLPIAVQPKNKPQQNTNK
jgi:predicted aldo/keto reductase-like oxidoreductase